MVATFSLSEIKSQNCKRQFLEGEETQNILSGWHGRMLMYSFVWVHYIVASLAGIPVTFSSSEWRATSFSPHCLHLAPLSSLPPPSSEKDVD